MTGLAFLFIFGKKVPRKLIWKEIYTVLVLSVAALQILLYQPLNLLTAEDKVTEYEVEITDTYHRIYDVFFTDKDGVAQKAKFYSIFSTLSYNLWFFQLHLRRIGHHYTVTAASYTFQRSL